MGTEIKITYVDQQLEKGKRLISTDSKCGKFLTTASRYKMCQIEIECAPLLQSFIAATSIIVQYKITMNSVLISNWNLGVNTVLSHGETLKFSMPDLRSVTLII